MVDKLVTVRAARALAALLTATLLSVGASACAGNESANSNSASTALTSTVAATTSSAASPPVETKADADNDNDIGAPNDDTNNNSVLNYGSEASQVEKKGATDAVKRYYAIAAAGNGAKACQMLTSSLSEAVVEDYGKGSAGPPYLKAGTTCPAVMELLFARNKNQLAMELPKLEVARVRLVGRRGFAILRFGTLPEREISVVHEGRVWRIGELLDSEVL